MSDFFSGQRGGGLAGGMSGGVKMAAVALLLHQLMKHARTQQGTAGPAQGQDQGGIGDVLGGLLRGGTSPSDTTGSMAGVDPRTGGQAPAQGGGIGDVLGGLLRGGGANPGMGAGMGGGLGGLLGGLLGGGGQGSGGLGGGMAGNAGLGGLLGGLAGMLGGMRRHGFAEEVDSWVAPGANRDVPRQAVEQEFDPQELDAVAQQLGTDRDSLIEELRRTMPELVDRLTPQGRVPEREDELGQGGVGEMLGSLLRPVGSPGGPPKA
ncbi:YidB family protein [Teichococcus oryzae]|uniref:DUF937 domain-containing protein n=1 Tax=Teichococcus oryzae TaxID=1608942 RepID=A0A5B2TBF3_9PROT|nr:YidB family protein [Pseudoroseomonas oryzae]KAA2211847.1 hypothetical protein F0Q34_17665 [Pseudoroseomonas oryzae]